MEIVDIYDENCLRTGKTMQRNKRIQSGEYILVVHILLENKQGKFLIQKRSRNKKVFPGLWEITGGSVKSGEESKDAVKRETFEEVGIKLEDNELELIGRLRRNKSFVDVYHASADFTKDDCILQKEEVDDIKLISKDEMLNMIRGAGHRDEKYKRMIEEYVLKK